MRSFVLVFLLLAGKSPTFASTSDRAMVQLIVSEFYRDRTSRGGGIYSRIAWPDSPLANTRTVYGEVIHDDFKTNDIKIWISGKRAIVSVHTSEARYSLDGPGGLHGPRDICTRQLELRQRNGEWRMYQILHEQCRFVER
jgi:hypothetical protein